MSDSSSNNLTVKAWLENYPIEDRIEYVRRLWFESVGATTVLESIMRSGDPSDELFAKYKLGIAKCRMWNELLDALQEYQTQLSGAHFIRWIDEYGVENLPWKGRS